MNIQILDSHLREFLKTNAKPKDIARALSLTSASVEKIEEFKSDHLYHIEITTNRIDMVSVTGIAREAAAVLPQFGFEASFDAKKIHPGPPFVKEGGHDVKEGTPPFTKGRLQSRVSDGTQEGTSSGGEDQTIEIINNDKLVKRICAVVLEVKQKESPQYIKDRLEAAGIRSLNNLIDVTNYVMLEIGHPSHVFDFDRLTTKKILVRESKKGEKIVTLDKKEHILPGGDIVADNGKGEIIDLLGIMGTLNSVVTYETKRILFFLDNNDPARIRRTSMSLGIRSEAAGINEKSVDPELAMPAILRGIELFKKIADAKVLSEIIDIYPKKWNPKTINVSEDKINQVIGLMIPLKDSAIMLERLNFWIKHNENSLEVTVPSYRDTDIEIEEDIIEEIARMYGYHNIPGKLPASDHIPSFNVNDKFYWEKKVKEALKYWGFTEVYTYSMVSKELFELGFNSGISSAKPGAELYPVAIKNPLDEDHVYMRTTLVPSMLVIVEENKNRDELKLFELANIYIKKTNELPDEIRTLSGVVKGESADFFSVKGIIEQLAAELGIKQISFKESKKSGADIFIEKNILGNIEIISDGLIAFELNFDLLTKHATMKKTFTPIPKYPPVIEDLALIVDQQIKTGEIIDEIKKQNKLIKDVSLLDKYEDIRTFHIIYQDPEKNLTNEEVGEIRKKIIHSLKDKFRAILKE